MILSTPRWKVILHRESWNKHVFLDYCGEYINTNEYVNVLDAQRVMPNAPTTPSNVDVILVFWEESLLLNESKQLSLERQSQGRNYRK
jgi:hypothetical protein